MTLCQLSLPEESEVGINHEINHVIRGGHVKLFAKPVHRQVSGNHGVKQEILQVLQGLGIGENGFCFVHATIISTDSGALVGALCHLVNWSGSQLS